MKSTPEVEQYIQGVTFPASKDELLVQARENDAPVEVISALEDLPVDKFEGAEEVEKAMGATAGNS
ncbi:MAG TPA: DUF2795 domain-containing protein [Candidatus Paceibacterota bacterium]|nr:DUF2795 domain-containing protein [Candidatus Paceibacterota bacterium]